MFNEARVYGFSFLQQINNNYSLYGNGLRRLMIPRGEHGQMIAYVIKGDDIELLSWEDIKSNHPINQGLEKILA
jgi:hypothetical protein